MMRKKIVSLCMALVLCLGLLPATALAAAPENQVIYVGGEEVTSGGYWTTDSDGSVTAYTGESTPTDNYIHYDADTNTLTLHNATIKKGLDYSEGIQGGTYIPGSAIGVLNLNGDAELTITLAGTNTIEDVSTGIFVLAHSSYTGDASLTITGSGSLTASGNINGINVQSNSGDATLTIQSADVTLTSNSGNGVTVQAGSTNSSGEHTITLSVEGGSLTASGSTGISFDSASSYTVSATNLTVSNNAIVRANYVGSNISNVDLQIGKGNNSSGGIVFDGNQGTVYGSVELQDNLTIDDDENLTIGEDASLTIPDDKTLTNKGEVTTTDGGTLTNNGTIDNSGTLPSNIGGNAPPSITTTSLADGAENTAYTATLAASGTGTITWSNSGNLPAGLTLDENTGVISGTPTADGTFNFTVKATNTGGSDSKSLSITIGAQTNVPVTGVSLNTSTLNLIEGGTGTLIATVLPDNATNKKVTWSSNAPGVATVDSSGKVTAVAPGTATITVTTEDGNKTATCAVTVTAATVPVTGVTLSQTQASLYCNRTPNTLALTARVAPDNATNKAVNWTSSDSAVATVDQNGVVTAVAPGTAVITATAADGRGASASCTVTVSSYLPPANPNYRITVEATQGGTVTADPTAAKAGATVTLTPAPDRGYQVGSVAVTDRFGDPVAVTEQADGTYTFVMPNGQVTVTVTFAEAPLPFHDVTEGDWFYDAVRYAYETGLMDGVGDNLFAPNSQTTRAQLVTILYRLAGEPEPGGDSGFSDVAAGTWYTDAVVWAAENGIVNGTTDATFAPGEDITREQLVTVLYRYAESKGYDVSASADLSGYPDADQIQSYAAESVAWAVAEGLIQGFEDNTLRPAGNATRAQIATILMRFCEGVAK
ncbi:S-layer homology domain-containing protein [Evtepia sp.]|uniref:S-layer homology domain-containing protein n=1 Tax=Evtepia sp. TaxID=2773933 RepID=UPI00399A50EC